MASQSLYRKWRSQTFSDLIGQEAVTRTLLNAVREGRLAHAYLFCGPRGTGKTSAARLLAKAINCAHPRDGEPCNECVSCREITAGHSPDVIEIDAASNTGVDNIRDLRETVNLLGSGGHFKVYVVDECFSYGELVTLADGTKMPIGKLVESQWQGEVLSFNAETGGIEPKRITRHMKKVPQIPTVRVTFDNNRSITCTINHKFYTPEGQVCAGHLQAGQFVYTQRERITRHQRAVVMGAAIGDGHIGLTGSAMRARLRINHSTAQREYLEYKVKLLGDLVRSAPRFQDGVGTFSKTGTYGVSTLSRPEIAQIHRELYGPDGRKQISRAYLDQLDELGLALWYLDDGTLSTVKYRYERLHGGTSIYSVSRASFSTHGFTVEEAWLICGWLREQWDIVARVSSTARGPVIWLTTPATKRLHELIAPYVPPSMEYKLLPAYRGRFKMVEDDGEASGLAVSVVKTIEPAPMPEYVYNIEVADNHNYFVRDMLVANCHMLTTSAFNALLKTLEEPPPHVIFVLATTEAHKVLPTIVSRCQRFDFRRISTRDIVARLRYVAEGEGLELEPAAAELLARAAQGGLRDALSLLDQAVAFCGTRVDFERVRVMLGLADPAAIRALLTHVAEQRSAEGLHQIAALVESGADLRQVQLQLGEEWRALMLARAGADVAQVMDRSAEEARELAALARQFSLEELMACARVCGRIETPARGLPVPQLALELMLLECVAIRRNGGAATAMPTMSAAAPAPQAMPKAMPAAAGRAPTPLDTAGFAPPVTSPAHAVEELELEAIAREEAPRQPMASSARPQSTPALPETPAAPTHGVHAALPPVTPVAPVASAAAMPARGRDDERLAEVQREWPAIHKVCRHKGPKVHALLKDTSLAQLEAGDPPVLVLRAKYKSHLEMLREPANKAVLEWAIEQVLETRMKVRFVLASAGDAQGQPATRPRGDGSGRAADLPPLPAEAGGNTLHPAAPVPPGPATAPAQSATAANGHQSDLEHDLLEDGSRDAGRAVPEDQSRSPSSPAPASEDSADTADRTSLAALEAEVLADPLIQEIMRTTGAEIAEIRPLDGDEAE